MRYRIREVDASDEDIAETIHGFNRLEAKFPALTADELEGEDCHWWLAYRGGDAVGFAGIVASKYWAKTGYLKRSFVTPAHRGHGLQLRFFRARERKARQKGWSLIISETTHATSSANNFIRAGYKIFEPSHRWAFEDSIYWRKEI